MKCFKFLFLVTCVSANSEVVHHELDSKPTSNFRGASESGISKALGAHLDKNLKDLNANDEKDLLESSETELSANKEEQTDLSAASGQTNIDVNVQAKLAAVSNDKKSQPHEDVKQGLQMYFDALQVVLGYEPAPSDTEELKRVMSPFVKEVEWSMGVMHPGFDKDLINDDAIMNEMVSISGKTKSHSKEKDIQTGRKTVDSELCLQKTREVFSTSMKIALWGQHGDLHSKDIQDIADQLDAEEARERLRKLGPLRKGDDEYRLIAKEAFKFAETEIGLGGIIDNGIKSWDMNNFWAMGFFASELWASALQISTYDTLAISNEAIHSIIGNSDFEHLIDEYNDHCATCPTGWKEKGLSFHGLQCTTGYNPSCDKNCLQAECTSFKGRWLDSNLEFDPYSCYMSVCPSGWNNLGRKGAQGLMCTMHRTGTCDEKCAEIECEGVGGSFPLRIDDVADNPYVCYV